MALNAAQRGSLGRSLLVHGPAGAGKGAFLEDLLALLMCTAPDRESRPCNVCRGCRDARARTHPDLVLGSPERWREMRSTGESIVAAARRWLGEASGAPIAAERRVVLIEDADRAGEPIQNALLKALEEPSDRHLFVLVAVDRSRLLPTVLSRCQPLRVGTVPRAELAAWLVDHERLPSDQADALARLARGLTGRAAAYARDPDLLAWRRRAQAELLSLLARGRADRFGSVRDLLDEASRRVGTIPAAVEADAADEGESAVPRTTSAVQRAAAASLVEVWLALGRDLLVAAAGLPAAANATEILPDLPATARRLDIAELIAFVRLLQRADEGLAQNAAPRLALEVAMLAWPTLES
jgi:DNA polymerase III gamma/tau subunit